MTKKLFILFAALVTALTSTIPVQTVGAVVVPQNFYSDSNIQFYDPNACAPGSDSTESSSSTAGADELDGHKLPAASGGTGNEDPVDSSGNLTTTGESMTFGKFAKKGEKYRDYYITMRWGYVKWAWNGSSSDVDNGEYNWYNEKPRKVLVTNPRTNKSIVAVVMEAGPAPWAGAKGSQNENGYSSPQRETPANYTGRVSGFPPKAIQALDAKQTENGEGDKLLYSWAPDQNAEPGPTGSNASSSENSSSSSDTTAACCPSGDTTAAAALTGSDNTAKVFNYLVGKGLKGFQAAGVIGNMKAESGVEPLRAEGIYDRKVKAEEFSSGTGGPGWGIVQWTPGSKFIAPTKADDKDPNKLEVQLDFLWNQLDGKTPSPEKQAGKDLKATKDAEDAVRAFQGDNNIGGNYTGYERPASQSATLANRIATAKSVLRKYGGNAPVATNPSDSESSMTCSCQDPTAGGGTAVGSTASSSSVNINDKLKKLANDSGHDVSVSVQSVDGSIKGSYSGDKARITRSSYKIYTAYTAIRAIEAGKANVGWGKSIGYKGFSGTIEQAINRSIVLSDNDAAWALRRSPLYNHTQTTRMLQNDVGLSSKTTMAPATEGTSATTKSTSDDYVKFLLKLYDKKLSGVSEESNYNKLIGYMKKATTDGGSARSGIAAGVGSKTTADKAGWANDATNDVGIVYGDKPYAVAIMTNAPNKFEVVKEIAKGIDSAIDENSDAGGGCDSGGDAQLRETIKVTKPGKFITLPNKYSCPEHTSRIDSRVAAGVAYLVNKYNMCITAGLEDGHNSHGAGISVDLVPKEGNSKQAWTQSTEAAARAIGWYGDGANDLRSSKKTCSPYSGYGQCMHEVYPDKFPKWMRWIGYNGATCHGDPWHIFGGCGAHLHISWASPNGSDAVSPVEISKPIKAVYTFPAPVPSDLRDLVE